MPEKFSKRLSTIRIEITLLLPEIIEFLSLNSEKLVHTLENLISWDMYVSSS